MATPPLRDPALEPTLDASRHPEGNTTELDRSEESATTSLYKVAIGPMGERFYLPVFTRFEAADRGGIGWNWAACLATLNWLAFRKLWSAALAYAGAGVGLALLIFGIGRLVFRFSEPVEMALLAAYLAVMFIVPGLFANALLHADCRKRMAHALAVNQTLPEACAMLARQAPSRSRLIALAVANLVPLGLVAAAFVNFPAAVHVPNDTLNSLASLDPLGTRTAPASASPASAASAVSAADKPVSASSSALPSAPSSAPSSAPASPTAPVTAASAPASAPSPAVVASAPVERVAVGVVQVDPLRKAPAVARAASAAQPAASSPQEVGKVYRSEPAPLVVAPIAAKPTVSVVGKPTKPPAAAKPLPASSAAKSKSKHLVNVGLFAQEANANSALAKLKEAGLPVYTEDIRSPTKGKLTRVRVGPFANAADAEAAAVKIRALGLDALLVRP